MKHLFQILLFLLFAFPVFSQKEAGMPPIPAMRQLHHEYIIQSLKKIDGFIISYDSVNVAMKAKMDSTIRAIRILIEKSESINASDKFKWLRGLNEFLTSYISVYQSRQINLPKFKTAVLAFQKAMDLDLAIQSIYPVFQENELVICNLLVNNFALKDNGGISRAKDIIVWKYCQLYPKNILSSLSTNPANEFADTLIVQAAFKDPEKLYDYAAAPNALGRKIQSNSNPLVRIISQLSVIKTGRMYFPFLDKLYHGTISIDSITPLLTDQNAEQYFKLLVATRMEYKQRMIKGDTAFLVNVLTAKLKAKSVELYINEINALHELNDLKVRFKKLDSLNAQELYYLAVMGESEMYTSSFVSGVYPRIFKNMQQPNADSLMQLVGDDYFKKFIKISATYNLLDDLLKKMDSVSAEKECAVL